MISGKLLVKNSPIKSIGTIFKIGVNSLKSLGQVTVGSGFTFALASELLVILKKKGKEAYFVPRIFYVIVHRV